MTERMETLAFRATWKHAVLEYRIKEIDPNQDLSRSAITERAIEAAKLVDDWKAIRNKLMKLNRIDTLGTPVSMQAKVSDASGRDIIKLRNVIAHDLKEYIERLQTPYFVQLIWLNYLLFLQQKRKTISEGEYIITEDEIDLPEMSKIFCEMMLTDKECSELKEIKKILKEWRHKVDGYFL